MKRKSDPLLLEMSTRLAKIEDGMRHQQPIPQVHDLWSGVVALARSSDLDGRIGPGDIVVGIGLAGAGFSIGIIGSLSQSITGASWEQSNTFLEYCTLAGCGLGMLRLALDSLAIPRMWSEFLDWSQDTLVEIVQAWRGGRDEPELNPTNLRDLPINTSNGTIFTDMPENSQFEYNTRTIPSCNTESGERTVSTDKLCAYLKFITNVDERRKDFRPRYINQKEWPDVRDWFKLHGWWDLPRNSPALPQACTKIRGTVTNPNEWNGTNEGTG